MLGSRKQPGEDDLRLKASQWRTDAEMDAASEREVMLRGGAIEHYVVGPLVLGRVPIGCASRSPLSR